MRLFIVTLALAFVTAVGETARADTWECFTSGNRVLSIAREGDSLWCGTSGGVFRWDRRNGTYTRYTTVNGLADNYVYTVFIDSKGTKWFCSLDGVARFDGSKWTTFSGANGFLKGTVRTLCEDRTGALWFGTANGACRYSGAEWTFYTPENSLLGNYNTSSIVQDSGGSLWFGTPFGVVRFENPEWTRFTMDDGLPADEVTCLLEDASGNIWAGTRQGLARFDGIRWQSISSKYVYGLSLGPDGAVWALGGHSALCVRGTTVVEYTEEDGLLPVGSDSFLASDDGGVWVTSVYGAARFDGTSWKTINRDNGLPSSRISVLHVDERETAWFGTDKGLASRTGDTVTVFQTADGPVDNEIDNLFFDSDGILWAISSNAGSVRSRYDGDAWSVVPIDTDLGNPFITSTFTDSRGRLWVITDYTISCRDGDTWTRILPEGGDRIFSTMVDSRGRVWCGRERGNVSVYENGAWQDIYPDGGGVLEGWVQTLLEDRDGRIWVGAANGIGIFDDVTWTFHMSGLDMPQGDQPTAIKCLIQDKTGTVWAGTNYGIMSFNGNDWTRYDAAATGCAAEYVLSGGMDQKGRLWFGTHPGGAVCFDGVKWKLYTTIDGLCSNIVKVIRFAPDGAVWFGTDRGISVLRESGTVGVESERATPLPIISLENRPNPFNPSTTISFTLPEPGKAELKVYDITGRKVRTLVSGPVSSGEHSVVWDGRDDSGQPVASGVYLSRLEAGGKVRNAKMLLVK